MVVQPRGLQPAEVGSYMMHPVMEQGVHARLSPERLAGWGIDMRKSPFLQFGTVTDSIPVSCPNAGRLTGKIDRMDGGRVTEVIDDGICIPVRLVDEIECMQPLILNDIDKVAIKEYLVGRNLFIHRILMVQDTSDQIRETEPEQFAQVKNMLEHGFRDGLVITPR